MKRPGLPAVRQCSVAAGRQARRAWVCATVREFQILAGELTELTSETRHAALELVLARVPRPNGPLEAQLLEGWTLRYEQECRRPVPAPASSIPDRVCSHIETHLCARLTLQTIAAAIKERPRAITLSFRPAYGMTIPQYVTERRFRAVRPLLAGGMKVEAAARIAGLSRKALYRLVRAKTGLTPRALGACSGADRI